MLDWLEVEAATREADLLPVPDYAEPLRAWRLWAIEDVGGPARLRSLYQRFVWPTGAPFAAQLPRAAFPRVAPLAARDAGRHVQLRHLRRRGGPHPPALARLGAASRLLARDRHRLALGRRRGV